MAPYLYVAGDDLPSLPIAWSDGDGDLIDFSTGHTFEVKVGVPGQTAQFTKTSGITGAATSPNIVIDWSTSGELNTLTPGVWAVQLTVTRTADSKQRRRRFQIEVLPAIA